MLHSIMYDTIDMSHYCMLSMFYKWIFIVPIYYLFTNPRNPIIKYNKYYITTDKYTDVLPGGYAFYDTYVFSFVRTYN